MQDCHGEYCNELGVKPASAQPLAFEQQEDTDDPGDQHRRHHDEVEQPALHRLQRFRHLRLGLGHCVVDEQPGQIEHAGHPGDDGDDMQSFQPQVHESYPRTRLSMRSTFAIGVSGRIP